MFIQIPVVDGIRKLIPLPVRKKPIYNFDGDDYCENRKTGYS